MKKHLQWIIVAFMSFFLCCQTVTAAQAQGPVELLQSLADQMIQALQKNKASIKKNRALVYSMANDIIVPHADLQEMSMRVLPANVWRSATPAQKTEFMNQFTTLLVRTYASALAEYTNQTVKFFPVRGGYEGKTNVTINSTIYRSDGPNVSVVYRALLKGSEWKLYDMTVEGVSLLESFRSQFAETLSKGNMSDLIRQLQTHNAKNSG